MISSAVEALLQVISPLYNEINLIHPGCTKKLKEKNPKIQCYLIEPKTAAILSGTSIINPGHKIQGGGYSKSFEELDQLKLSDKIDGFIQVSDEEVTNICRELAKTEGVFAGFSTGANVLGALTLLKESQHSGKTVVVLACDSGLKYLSTDLWE